MEDCIINIIHDGPILTFSKKEEEKEVQGEEVKEEDEEIKEEDEEKEDEEKKEEAKNEEDLSPEEREKKEREAEENFKLFLKAMMMRKLMNRRKAHVVEEEECEKEGEEKEDESEDTKKTIIQVDMLFVICLGISMVNLFFFFYNMYCIEYYNDKVDGEKKLDIVYTIFQYVGNTFILSLFEKVMYLFLLLYVINTIMGAIMSAILPKGGKSGKGGIGGSITELLGGGKKSEWKIEEKGKTGVTFQDVAGCHIAKRELLELIDFLQNREKYTSLGAQLPKGALLYGPSGTGKTMIAKALAHEVSYNYIYVQGSDFKKPLVGLGPQSVKDLFETARKHAPCIIFVDEIDSIAKKRGSDLGGGGGSTSHSEEDAVLNTFLAELDGFKERGDVFVMGATNRLNVIDEALLRPKRFDRVIHFKLPNVDERCEIIESYFQKMKIAPELNTMEYKKLLAKKSYGFSGAQIFNMCNEACILAGRGGDAEVTEKHIHEALDYIHLGKTEEHVKAHLTEEEQRRTAYHETGHAIMAIYSKELENPTQISIVPHNKGSLGVTLTPINEHKYSRTRTDYVARLGMLLGGRMAEEIFIGNVSGGAKDDLNKFNALVDDYFNSGIHDIYLITSSEYRGDKVRTSEKYLEKIEEEKRLFIDEVVTYTRKMMMEKSDVIHQIAQELMEKEDLYEEDLAKYWVDVK